MAGVITTDGLAAAAAYNGTRRAWLNTLTLRLFKNNWTPAVADHVAAATEANFDGYAAVAANNWGAPALDANNNEEWDHPQITFSDTGAVTPNTIYGYYLTDGTGALMMAEKAAASFVLDAAGKTYSVTLKFYSGQLSGAP